jgi:hypothetical protein
MKSIPSKEKHEDTTARKHAGRRYAMGTAGSGISQGTHRTERSAPQGRTQAEAAAGKEADEEGVTPSERFRRIKIFFLWGSLVLSFMLLTNSRREENIFWVSRRIVGACTVYCALRFIADSFTKRGPDSN